MKLIIFFFKVTLYIISMIRSFMYTCVDDTPSIMCCMRDICFCDIYHYNNQAADFCLLIGFFLRVCVCVCRFSINFYWTIVRVIHILLAYA